MRFWLGAHEPAWLARVDVPLFVSHTRLARRVCMPRARGPWALDSGAFGEVGLHGQFATPPAAYVAAVRRYADEIGHLAWASQQDHMCEPFVLARSSLASTVVEAQRWTVNNLLTLRSLDPSLPIIPVVQGQTRDDYLRCVDLFDRAGIDLAAEPLVGLGSVCRRQNTAEIGAVIAALDGLSLHGFGVKAEGLDRYGWLLSSADSLAWSYGGRRIRPCPQAGLTSCNNCLHHALTWRASVVAERAAAPVQMELA